MWEDTGECPKAYFEAYFKTTYCLWEWKLISTVLCMKIYGGQSNFDHGVKVRSLGKFSITFQCPKYPSFSACCAKFSICVFYLFGFCLLSFCLSVCQFNTVWSPCSFNLTVSCRSPNWFFSSALSANLSQFLPSKSEHHITITQFACGHDDFSAGLSLGLW